MLINTTMRRGRRSLSAFARLATLLIMAAISTIMALAASASASGPNGASAVFNDCPPEGRRRGEEDDDDQSNRLAITTDQKLQELIDAEMTSAEMAVATASSLRAVEERRRALRNGKTKVRVAKLDGGIDDLHAIFSLLTSLNIQPTNIRAWLIGRSRFLEEQRPIVLLGAGQFEVIREAAIAYATNETPAEFLEGRDPLPRPKEPVVA